MVISIYAPCYWNIYLYIYYHGIMIGPVGQNSIHGAFWDMKCFFFQNWHAERPLFGGGIGPLDLFFQL